MVPGYWIGETEVSALKLPTNQNDEFTVLYRIQVTNLIWPKQIKKQLNSLSAFVSNYHSQYTLENTEGAIKNRQSREIGNIG